MNTSAIFSQSPVRDARLLLRLPASETRTWPKAGCCLLNPFLGLRLSISFYKAGLVLLFSPKAALSLLFSPPDNDRTPLPSHHHHHHAVQIRRRSSGRVLLVLSFAGVGSGLTLPPHQSL